MLERKQRIEAKRKEISETKGVDKTGFLYRLFKAGERIDNDADYENWMAAYHLRVIHDHEIELVPETIKARLLTTLYLALAENDLARLRILRMTSWFRSRKLYDDFLRSIVDLCTHFTSLQSSQKLEEEDFLKKLSPHAKMVAKKVIAKSNNNNSSEIFEKIVISLWWFVLPFARRRKGLLKEALGLKVMMAVNNSVVHQALVKAVISLEDIVLLEKVMQEGIAQPRDFLRQIGDLKRWRRGYIFWFLQGCAATSAYPALHEKSDELFFSLLLSNDSLENIAVAINHARYKSFFPSWLKGLSEIFNNVNRKIFDLSKTRSEFLTRVQTYNIEVLLNYQDMPQMMIKLRDYVDDQKNIGRQKTVNFSLFITVYNELMTCLWKYLLVYLHNDEYENVKYLKLLQNYVRGPLMFESVSREKYTISNIHNIVALTAFRSLSLLKNSCALKLCNPDNFYLWNILMKMKWRAGLHELRKHLSPSNYEKFDRECLSTFESNQEATRSLDAKAPDYQTPHL